MTRPRPPVEGIHEAALYVQDLVRDAGFWERLGFAVIASKPGRHVFLQAGNDILLLFDAEATRNAAGGVPPHGAEGAGHVAFAVTDHAVLDQWRETLHREAIPIETEVDWPSGGRSLYFRDPSGNSIELITRGSWGI